MTVLPRWVRLVPPTLYTPALRRGIETALALWSAISIVWAFWQLYRNLPLLRELVAPFVRIGVRYADVLAAHANAALQELTEVWAHYLRPVQLLAGPFCALLEQLLAGALVAGATAVRGATLALSLIHI